MGVIDGLRSLAQRATAVGGTEEATPATGAPDAGAPDAGATDAGATKGSIGEQRGDFMMLPPLGRTFGSMTRLQQPIGDFLVTRRPTAVTNEPLTHGADAGPMGLITARARRRPRRSPTRSQRDALVHRSRDDEGHEGDDAAADQVAAPLPPRAAPRRLAATVKPAIDRPAAQASAAATQVTQSDPAPSLATPLLPSRAEVGRAVRGPAVRQSAGRTAGAADVVVGKVIEPSQQAEPAGAQTPPSAMASAPDPAPVLRRRASRGRINAPIEPDDPDAALIEQALAEFVATASAATDRDASDAGGGESAPELIGRARVRGAAMPEAASSPDAKPQPGSDGAPVAQQPQSPGATATAQPMLSVPPADPVASPISPSMPAPGSATPPPSTGRPIDAVSAPIDPMQRGTSRATPLDAPAPSSSGAPGPGLRAPAASQASRPTLAARPSLVSAGNTGIQRRARDEKAGARATTSTGLRPATPSGAPRSSAPDDRPTGAGSRSVAVPEKVRQAVRDSVGTAPSQVVVHEGGKAEALTRSVNAEAFTRDGEIFLAADAPLESARGQQLLAHELTHVVQQKGGTEQMPAEHTREGQDLEAGARRAEGLMESGHNAHPTLHHRGSVVNAPAVPQMFAGDGVQRSGRDSKPQPGAPVPIVSNPALSSGGPQPVNFADDNWRTQLGQGMKSLASNMFSEFELSLSSGPPPITKDEKSGRLRDLERQAHELYPLIRQRLRAELVRDKERRGRMSREWG